MAILVCGGAGYIGSHMTALLREQGEDVVVADNLQKGHRGAIDASVPFHQVDLRDEKGLSDVFSAHDIHAVIDFAADSLVGESVKDPLKYYDNNLYGTTVLLRTMARFDVKKIVFSSTAAVYGEPERVPIYEEDSKSPTNPYGETKLAVERMLRWADEAYGITWTALRYFNAAGAHSSGRIGEDHAPESHLIPLVLAAALGRRESITVFGDDYPTADGSCVRDYIHVSDLSMAHLKALQRMDRGGASAVFNLGNGTGFSVKQVIETARMVTGRAIRADITGRRGGDPAVLIASSEKAKKELGWEPQTPLLENIISSAWTWHESHPEGYGDR
jgi:UDP-glucose 4-epimerase